MAQRIAKANRKVFVTEKGVFVAHEKDDILGRGTYGIVYRAYLETDPSVKKAVKIFSPDTMDEAEGIPSTTLREINALKTIVHPNVMAAEEVVIPDARSPTDMFFVMELCKGTLKDKIIDLIRKHLNNDPIWLNPPNDLKLPPAYIKDVKIIIWQLLNSLAVVHSRGVMHRDLKPVNILWGYDDLLKLADFGLARFVRGNQNAENTVLQQTGEVQTMWYRAPEVLLGDEKYGLLVDDWSLGCVIAELFRFRKNSSGRIEPAPLFQGRSDIGTLMIIFETLGTPLPKVNKTHEYLGKLRYWNDGYPKWLNGTLQQRVPLLDPLGHELLETLLRLSPTSRQAARFLLNHPWFDDVKPFLTNIIPWYRGFEENYKRMLAVDRLPLPRTMKEVAAAQKQRKCDKVQGSQSTMTSSETTNSAANSKEKMNETTTNDNVSEDKDVCMEDVTDHSRVASKCVLLGSDTTHVNTKIEDKHSASSCELNKISDDKHAMEDTAVQDQLQDVTTLLKHPSSIGMAQCQEKNVTMTEEKEIEETTTDPPSPGQHYPNMLRRQAGHTSTQTTTGRKQRTSTIKSISQVTNILATKRQTALRRARSAVLFSSKIPSTTQGSPTHAAMKLDERQSPERHPRNLLTHKSKKSSVKGLSPRQQQLSFGTSSQKEDALPKKGRGLLQEPIRRTGPKTRSITAATASQK